MEQKVYIVMSDMSNPRRAYFSRSAAIKSLEGTTDFLCDALTPIMDEPLSKAKVFNFSEMEKSYIRRHRVNFNSNEWYYATLAAMQFRLDISISEAVKYYDEYQGDVVPKEEKKWWRK